MSWQPTAALLRVSLLPAALAVLAVLTRRPDLLVVAAPLALAAVPLVRRPAGRPGARLGIGEPAVAEGATVRATVGLADVAGAQTATVVLSTPEWVRPAAGGRLASVVRPGRSDAVDVEVQLLARRWGRSTVGPATVTLSACGGLLRAGPETLAAARLQVLPLSARYTGVDLLPRTRAAVGLHRSPRAGEGSELTGIRPFGPGDRIRRINWRTSLRTDQLQVNATTTERDAGVHLLLDARYDGGTSGGVGGASSGIDIAVRATAALTACYLGLGDRVALTTTTGTMRTVPARSGRGQLERVLAALLDTSAPRAGGPEPQLPVPPDLDPRALVLVVSPLVGRYVFEQAATVARSGHPVVVVDTLPPDAALPDDDRWAAPVTALWRLERSTRIGQLTDLGVPVVGWQGAGTLDTVLRELTRAAARAGGRR